MNFNFVDLNFSFCTEILKSNEMHFYTYGKTIDMVKYSIIDLESQKNLMLYFESPIMYSHFDTQNEMEIFLDVLRNEPSPILRNFRDVVALGNSVCRELTYEEKLELMKCLNDEKYIE